MSAIFSAFDEMLLFFVTNYLNEKVIWMENAVLRVSR